MSSKKAEHEYSRFDKLSGSHPLQKVSEDIYVNYKARIRRGGSVFYLNFDLARELSLIPITHNGQLDKKLEAKILDTFGLVIINEFDIENNIKFPDKDIKGHQYMATRYLQLQHADNIGKNSGDGRSIWNGTIKGKSFTWDVSSRGTGATKLSPATSLHNKFFQSGDPTISYGCGYAEMDEAIGAAFFSDVFNKNQIRTERILAIIDYGDGICVTIRSYPNLLRPSHFFVHLKQNNLETLTSLVDYHIDREIKNSKFPTHLEGNERYRHVLETFVDDFAKMAAKFEDEYIFCWLDWDGDNILMDGAIIDYGSIRQFGLFHHEYRYDDVERFSTNILEQKQKVKHMIMTFAQVIDYVTSKKKERLDSYKTHWSAKLFDKKFDYYKNCNFLEKIGCSEDQRTYLLEKHLSKVEDFRSTFSYFEKAKSLAGLHEVPDGVNCNAIFCMRDLLRVLPQLYIAREESLEYEEFIEIMASTYAIKEDLELSPYRKNKIKDFQKSYWQLLDILAKESKLEVTKILLDISMRSAVKNRYDRITGDSIAYIVSKILENPKKYKTHLHEIINDFTLYQSQSVLVKDNKKIKYKHEKIVQKFFDIVVECREGL
jgi:hypothetical protein